MLAAIAELPQGWFEDGLINQALEQATKVATVVATMTNFEGPRLCVRDSAKQYRYQERIEG